MQEVVGSIPTSSTISSRGFPMKTLQTWFLAVLLLGPALCCAQADAVFVAPRELPGAAGGLSINYRGDVREAIAVVSLTVKADGSTADLQLVDGYYSQEIGQSILRRVSALRFASQTIHDEVSEQNRLLSGMVRAWLQAQQAFCVCPGSCRPSHLPHPAPYTPTHTPSLTLLPGPGL